MGSTSRPLRAAPLNVRAYTAGICNPHIRLPRVGQAGSHVWHLYVVRCVHRDALQRHLAAQGVGTAIHYPTPPHRQNAYAHLAEQPLPLTEQLSREVLSLPMGPALTDAEVAQVIEACNRFTPEA